MITSKLATHRMRQHRICRSYCPKFKPAYFSHTIFIIEINNFTELLIHEIEKNSVFCETNGSALSKTSWKLIMDCYWSTLIKTASHGSYMDQCQSIIRQWFLLPYDNQLSHSFTWTNYVQFSCSLMIFDRTDGTRTCMYNFPLSLKVFTATQ